MKKLIAVICAVALCCGGLAGCGDKKSEKADSTAEKITSSAADESVTNAESETTETEELTMAEAYTKSIENANFRTLMVTSSDFTDDTTTMVEVSGDDYHMSVGDGENQTELYVIGGVMYMLSHAEKSYIKDETPDEMYLNMDTSNYTMGVDDSYIFIDSVIAEGDLICETYHAPDLISGEMPSGDEDGEVTVYKYYFEKDGKTPVKIEMSAYGLEQTTTFKEFSFDIDSIVIPDLSDWTDDTENSGFGLDTDVESEELDESEFDANIDVEQADAAETE
ncbi:hypothetical protein [Ruminococcus sp.]|uniref:hypothetical protein n=1 Tax=Ruminococcus sp. TaxID=41978 RepID=UPI001B16F7A5|nr:hypothetical protein [Ruminococcus sp.]MBO5558803.1 hypothetical protein [Ruminococcus sp.]